MENPAIKVESAADALDQIRLGGDAHHRVLREQAHRLLRVGELAELLAEVLRRFEGLDELALVERFAHLTEPLVGDEQDMVADLEEGMVIPGVGEVKDIGPCPGCGQPNCTNMVFTVGEQSIMLDRDVEIVVEKK